jgi:uncharacterized protein YegL
MTSYFYLRDVNDQVISNFTDFQKDIKIAENINGVNVPRNVLDGECKSTEGSYSIIFVVDISGSMGDGIDTLPDGKPDPNGNPKKIDVVREAMLNLANNLDLSRCEVSIVLFGNSSHMGTGYTSNKVVLKNIINTLNMSLPSGGTNFNAAFLRLKENVYDSTQSALYYCKKRDFDNPTFPEVASYKPIIIFLTDGNNRSVDDMGRPYDGVNVIRIARERNAHCYVIQFGSVPVDAINMPYLQGLASIEVGVGETYSDNLWLNVMSGNDLGNIFTTIISKANSLGEKAPCSVRWVSDCDGGKATITFPNYLNAQSEIKFVVADIIKPIIKETNLELTSSIAVAYQWYADGVRINGATSQNYKPTKSGAYRVEITDKNGCVSMSDIFNFTLADVADKIDFGNYIISPNPVSEKAIISIENKINGICSISILNITGYEVAKVCENLNFNSGSNIIEFDSGNIPSGIYLCMIEINGNKVFRKFVVVN